jgi:hypothetical protein
VQLLSKWDDKVIEGLGSPNLRNLKSLFVMAFSSFPGPEARSGIQRLAVPHTFNEGLGFREAAIAVTDTLLRIFLSCLLFAVWGVFALSCWNALGDSVWRWVILVPLVALLLCSFLASMLAISAASKFVKRAWR